jgi:hypothetical protein
LVCDVENQVCVAPLAASLARSKCSDASAKP